MAYAYQRSNYGDYYQAGGIFGTIGRIAGSLLKKTPIGAAAATAYSVGKTAYQAVRRTPTKRAATPIRQVPPPPMGTLMEKRGQAEVLGPGTEGTMVGRVPRKRGKINYGNVKALKRADRRIDGFVKVARSALKHTNYKVVSKSAGRGGRSGSRGVITRSEAARALRD